MLMLVHCDGLTDFRYEVSSCVEEQTWAKNVRIKNWLKIFNWKIERKYIF